MVRFELVCVEGGGNGTGFAKLPVNANFKKSERIKVNSLDLNESFFATVRDYDGLGFYIPKSFHQKLDAFGGKLNFDIERTSDFYAKVTDDGILYVPQTAVLSSDLKSGDIIEISTEGKTSVARVHSRLKDSKEEFYFTLGKNYLNKSVSFSIVRKLSVNHMAYDLPVYKISKDVSIIFDAKNPTLIKTNISLNSLAFYLGAFFADGTKRGFNWGICASTPEQARFYFDSHASIIENSKIFWTLSFSSLASEQNSLLERLSKEWSSNGFVIDKFRFHKFRSMSALKHNPKGTLVFKENRAGVLNYYNHLLKTLIEKIVRNKDKKLAFEFLCGVLEGDGTVNAKKRAHIQIASNINDYKTIETVLNLTGMSYALIKETKTRIYFRIGVLDIIKNLELFYPLIFKYYPKRRWTLILRMGNIGVVKFLLGKQRFLSGWIKADFKKAGILKKNYTLTKKGLKITRILQKMFKEVE